MAHTKKPGRYHLGFGLLLLVALIYICVLYFHSHTVAVLQPRGEVAQKEKSLMLVGLLLSAIVVIPVFIMTTVIAYKYRESNTGAKYTPNWDGSRFFETIWWGIPILIISVLSLIAWNSAHALDPFKPLGSNAKPMTIQVVALDWKWLFIYPRQGIASVNYVRFPQNTPIDFQITSDSVMNSFWIPQLGGQIYAMPGMATGLNLSASQSGSFRGSSANISGSGFSDMIFTARASSMPDFNRWVNNVEHSPRALSQSAYGELAKPSRANPVVLYSSVQADLFSSVILKYMVPAYQAGSGYLPNLHGAGQ
jgi:cytochrome o ubiquinol oxidase subunit 2